MKSIFSTLIIIFFMFSCGDDELDDNIEINIPVSIQEVKPGSIKEFVTTTATVNAIKNTILKSEIEGKYRLAVNPNTGHKFVTGDYVNKGKVIVFLDNPEHENNIKIESFKLNLNISKREFEKQQSLYEKGGVTLRELKNAERTFIDAQYSYDNAKIQIDKLTIRAPFDGRIVDLPYHTEDTKIDMNSIIVQLMDYSQLYAEVNFPVSELDRIKVKQRIQVTHYNIKGDTLSGEVSQVSPTLNPETRSFAGMVLIDNQNYVLRPGMFVKIETIVAQKDSVIVIPKEIILSKRKGKTVFIIEKGAAQERIINTGLANADFVEIREGLKIGERLVTNGFETLHNRSKVKIVR